ncbi:MAG: hypothetical protein KY445_14540 [Armatimonadetes bacterium]|nr:hypothetical protein [Armatimonadota bacterium]
MKNFDLKRADFDAILYNTDGRNYDLKLQDQRLEILARSTAFMERLGLAKAPAINRPPARPKPLVKRIGAALCAFGALLVLRFVTIGTITSWQFYALVVVSFLEVWFILPRLQPIRWTLDKNTGQFCADKREIARLDEIVALRAWKKGGRFLLALRLRDGREIRLGLFKLAGKEWAWRQDAAQIAQFLGVPLEIPPVIPA